MVMNQLENRVCQICGHVLKDDESVICSACLFDLDDDDDDEIEEADLWVIKSFTNSTRLN
jgi:hypothetical protein